MWGDPLYAGLDRATIPVTASADQWRRLVAAIAANRPTLCVDFDGTMTLSAPYSPGVPTIGPQPGLRRALAEWIDAGYRLVVLTARPTADVWPWLAQQQLTPFVSEVTNTKPPAVAYIDDRAVSFGGDWDAVRARVRELSDAPTPPCRAAAVPQPTPAQANAENYPKTRVRVHGLQVAIENPAGSIRRSKHTKPDGSPVWETRMAYAYGDIKRTEGADGDAVDVFLTPDPEGSDRVFVINQVDPATGRFDEHKVILGARNETEARGIYLANYDATGPQRIGSIREMSIEDFKVWAFDGPRRVEAASYFADCPRNERGWCEPGEGGEASTPPTGTRAQVDAGKAPALRDAIHQVENQIAPLRDREVGVAIRGDGTVIARREGRENEVRFSAREKRQFGDAVVVHNHPGGATFSNSDVRSAIVHNAAEVRAVTPSGTLYALQRPAGGWPSPIAVQFARDLAAVELAKEAKVPQADRPHESWVRVAEQLGLTYHRARL